MRAVNTPAAILIAAILLFQRNDVRAQSNYASQANNVEYQGDGLPEQATLDGKVTKLDDLSPEINLNRTKANLNCGAGSMQIDLKFKEKFYGIAYADYDRNSACQVAGKGDLSYKLELPLKGCGTKQEPQRVFTNNIVVRFHPGLEMDGDEVITIVCRYPPPIVLPPVGLPDFILNPLVPASVIEPPLKGFQILLIICAIMFLTLVLLGLGVSYYCLRRRPLTVVRRHPFSTASGSEITKLSGSSLGNISQFEGLKIPRAHAPVHASGSSSGSEGPLISDTLPSDYPSESHSENGDMDTRSLPVSSAGSFENRAFQQDNSSFYSEGYGHTQELSAANAVATPALVPRLPLAVKSETQPKFDVQVRVKRAPPPPPSPMTSDTESVATNIQRNLDTIHEQREESIRTLESPQPPESSHFTYVPELHQAPKYIQAAPVYSRILRRQQEIHEREVWPSDYVDAPPISSARSLASLNTEMTDTHSMTEMVDDSHSRLFYKPAPPPPPPIAPVHKYLTTVEMESNETFPEPPIAVYRKPEVTSHVVDDVFLRTITEKRTIEDIERHKRMVTEYKTKPKPVDTKWDVTIRNLPGNEELDGPDWENFSDISSASGMTLTPKPERAERMTLPPPNYITETGTHLYSPELVGNIGHPDAMPPLQNPVYTSQRQIPPQNYISTLDIPLENPEVPNWNVLIRVLKPVDTETTTDYETTTDTSYTTLTMADKVKWRQIITTESTLRSLLTEAVIREDFERIRTDVRYEKLFEPHKWDVIIRILTPQPDKSKNNRYRKKSDWDTRSRRSSLPTLYEYESDGGSSIRTLTNEPTNAYPTHSRKTSRSSYRSDNIDMRSMSEMTVDFARPAKYDTLSDASSYYPSRYYDSESENEADRTSTHRSLVRSLSQPSLARSASEFTERWVAPQDTGSDMSSPDVTPKPKRKVKPGFGPLTMSTFNPREMMAPVVDQRSAVWQQSSSRVTPATPGGSQHLVTQSQYVAQSSTSFKGGHWYGGENDGDSEASFK